MLRTVVAITALVLGLGEASAASAQAGQEIGRYQLVSEHQGTIFLVDTATGRVWRYTALTAAAGEKVPSPCKGLVTCFLEIDRLKLNESGSGWVPERLTRQR